MRVDGMYPGNRFEGDRPCFISVTNIIDNTIAKPALYRYYCNKAVEAMLANPDWTKDEAWEYIRDYSRQAMERGSRVHSLVESYLGGSNVVPLEGDEGYLQALDKWLSKRQAKIMATESTIYHSSGYAGTMDAIAHIGTSNKPTIVDFKTGSGLYPEYLFQASAYREAVEEELGVPADGVEVVLLRPDGTYKTSRADRAQSVVHYAAFAGAKTIYEVRNHKKLTNIGYFAKGGDSSKNE